MRTATLLIALSAALRLYAQPCAPNSREVDPVTKLEKIVYRTGGQLNAYLVSHGTDLNLELTLLTGGMASMVDSAALDVVFYGGEVLTLYNEGVSLSSYGNTYSYVLDASASLTREQLHHLARNEVQLIRWHLTTYDHDQYLKPKQAEKLRSIAACLHGNLP